MPIAVSEAANSREWDSQGACVLRYVIDGTANDYLALLALDGVLPAYVTNIYGDECQPQDDKPSLVAVKQDTVTDTGIWTSEVVYKPPATLDQPDPYPIGSIQLTVDTTGGTMHRTASLETVDSYSAVQGGAPSFEGAIGVTKDSIEGVDVPMPVFNLKADKVWDPDSPPNLGAMYGLTATVNGAQFTITDSETGLSLTFAKGELLFRGGSLGAQRGDGGIPVTYAFEASPNATGLAVGRITGITKEGWHHLWVYYEEEEDATAKRLLRRPFYAYVERVIPYGDFSGLGLS